MGSLIDYSSLFYSKSIPKFYFPNQFTLDFQYINKLDLSFLSRTLRNAHFLIANIFRILYNQKNNFHLVEICLYFKSNYLDQERALTYSQNHPWYNHFLSFHIFHSLFLKLNFLIQNTQIIKCLNNFNRKYRK